MVPTYSDKFMQDFDRTEESVVRCRDEERKRSAVCVALEVPEGNLSRKGVS
jgi:hypothetical protein